MKRGNLSHWVVAPALLAASPALAEPVIWGVQANQLEYRIRDGEDVLAWRVTAIAGTDELRVALRSEAEYGLNSDAFATLENQLRIQKPVSDFFDGVVGVRVDTPKGPDRVYGVIGLHGLAPQWFEIDADLFVSDEVAFRIEAEYEALITNRLILAPSVEVDLPFTNDRAIGVGAFGPKIELGARLSYDLVDRMVSPYVGVHYERVFGETADLAREDGEGVDAFAVVAGVKVMF